MALFYQEQGNYAAAEPLYAQALAIYEKAFGSDSPRVAVTLQGMAELLKKSGRTTDAEKMEFRARSIQAMPKKSR